MPGPLTETSSVVVVKPTGDFSTFMETMWGLGTELAVRGVERYAITVLACLVISYFGTEVLKKFVKGYVRANFTARPWWYDGLLLALPAWLGMVSGGAIGMMQQSELGGAEGMAVGLCSGLLAYILVKWAMKKFGVVSEDSQDLTMQPMRAVRVEVATDPVVSEVPTDPMTQNPVTQNLTTDDVVKSSDLPAPAEKDPPRG